MKCNQTGAPQPSASCALRKQTDDMDTGSLDQISGRRAD
jgi:hypothetical protein